MPKNGTYKKNVSKQVKKDKQQKRGGVFDSMRIKVAKKVAKMAEIMTNQITIEFELDIKAITQKILHYPHGFDKEVFDFNLLPKSVNNDDYIDTLLSTSIYDFLDVLIYQFNRLELNSKLSISFDEPMTFYNPEMSILYWGILWNMPGGSEIENPVNVYHAYYTPKWDELRKNDLTNTLLSDLSKTLQNQRNVPVTGYKKNVYDAYSSILLDDINKHERGKILTQQDIKKLLLDNNNEYYLTFAYYLDGHYNFPSKFKFKFIFNNVRAAQNSWKVTKKIDLKSLISSIFETEKNNFLSLLDQKVDEFIRQKLTKLPTNGSEYEEPPEEEEHPQQEVRQKRSSILRPLPPIQNANNNVGGIEETHGGKKTSKKEVLGKMRCIYKIPGDRKEYVKYKGKLITVKDYKMLNKKPGKVTNKKPKTVAKDKKAKRPKKKST